MTLSVFVLFWAAGCIASGWVAGWPVGSVQFTIGGIVFAILYSLIDGGAK